MSFLPLARSGPTIGVGLTSTFQSASLASSVSLSHFFCSCAPDRLVGAVLHGVGRAEVAALDEPDLQALAPAERAVGLLAHRHLLAEDAQALLEGQRQHERRLLGRPAVVGERVVIVLLPVAGHVQVKGDVPRQAVHAVPVIAGQGRR